MDYSRLFHHCSKDHTAGQRPFAAEQEEALATTTVQYKTYPGAEIIALPRPEVACGLSDAIHTRRSGRNRGHDEAAPLSLVDFGALLGWSCGIISRCEGRDGEIRDYHRAQPSGGGRYPIELYVLNFSDGDVARGIWHYRVRDHALELLFDGAPLDAAADNLFFYDWIAHSSVVLVMSGLFDRVQRKYGERGYRYLLLEAGHIGQNLHLVGAARKLEVHMVGGTNDQAIETLLDIDGNTESVIYAAAVNKPRRRE